MRKLLGALRRAVNDFNMISDGDKIAVGVSGGKDSLALLHALSLYQKFAPESFELVAVMIDLGFPGMDEAIEKIKSYVEGLGVEFILERSNIGEVVFNERKEKNPCSLCAKMRRGALNSIARSAGANKVALGHHADDLLETFLLSFIYEGRLSTFMPVTYLDKTDMTVIRPFMYADERDIKGVARRFDLPVMHNPCPADHHTQREYMKELVRNICKDIPIARDRMTEAIVHSERYNLIPKKEEKEDK